MRLLDTTTKELTEFQSQIPVYAILSHVWEREEVTFQDIADLEKAKQMQGFTKIAGACDTAIRDGIKYIWIDTCCINKESSAELSEAINSMYAWYHGARVCYAYLCDVPSEGDHEDPYSLFAMSRWFTRGWTLQELIAPLRVVFYGADWVDIGTKATLQETISAVTGISPVAIVGGEYSNSFNLDDVPVAVRMSWAANRNTTRKEDLAYCLLGLFGVNMPMLYGEGRQAFIRLQHEIIKKSTDHSIFAWTADDNAQRGMLARSPSEFHNSGRIERIFSLSESGDHPNPYTITNKGLYIELPLVVVSQDSERKTLALLNCCFSASGKSEPIAITIEESYSRISSEYVRSGTMELQSGIETGWNIESPAKISSLYIADDYSNMDASDAEGKLTILLRLKVPREYGELQHAESEPEHCWEEIGENEWKYAEQTMEDSGQGAVLVFENPPRGHRFAVIIGSREPEAMVWCDVLTDLKDEDAYSIFESYLGDYPSASRWVRKKRFLDRFSANLTDGWSVVVSSGTSNIASVSGEEFFLSAEVEIKKSQKQRNIVQPPKRPDDKFAYFIVPPAPKHGFTVDISNLQPTSSNANWVERLGSFILYTDGSDAEVLPFKSNHSNERFCLLVGPDPDEYEQVYTRIEKEKPGDPTGVLETKGTSGKAYTAILDQGRLVFVTVRRCKDVSGADFIINLSVGGNMAPASLERPKGAGVALKAKKRLFWWWRFSK